MSQGAEVTLERYTREHEYIRVEGDIGTVGITKHAAEQLGDIVFVDLPQVGRVVTQGDATAVVESVKAASDVYAPASGEVIEINGAIMTMPALVNQDPEGQAWFFKVRLKDKSELDRLMDAAAYRKQFAAPG
jgi:glycine cleavage system H protein